MSPTGKGKQCKIPSVTFISKLSWTEHIKNISPQAHPKLAFIHRNLWHYHESLKKTLWNPLTKHNIERLKSVQRKESRVCQRSLW